MKEMYIRINPTIPDGKRYSNYRGKKFWVTEAIDNLGDRCITQDEGQPFMFISAKDCEIINPLITIR